MKKNGYVTTTIEEFLRLPTDEENIWTIPQKALSEIAKAKKSKTDRAEKAYRTLKKYLINVRQAQTNAKIVEALLA